DATAPHRDARTAALPATRRGNGTTTAPLQGAANPPEGCRSPPEQASPRWGHHLGTSRGARSAGGGTRPPAPARHPPGLPAAARTSVPNGVASGRSPPAARTTARTRASRAATSTPRNDPIE